MKEHQAVAMITGGNADVEAMLKERMDALIAAKTTRIVFAQSM